MPRVKGRTARYTVELELPEGYTAEDMRMYVKTAVQNWCHGGDPDDEMYWLRGSSVKVKTVKDDNKEGR
jgi:hypothetical protein